jgi:hypothetical protein
MRLLGWKTDVGVAVLAGFLVTFANESATHLARQWFGPKENTVMPETKEQNNENPEQLDPVL